MHTACSRGHAARRAAAAAAGSSRPVRWASAQAVVDGERAHERRRLAGQTSRPKSMLDRYYERAQQESVPLDEDPKDWMKSNFTGRVRPMPFSQRYSSPDVASGVLLPEPKRQGRTPKYDPLKLSIKVKGGRLPLFLHSRHVGDGYMGILELPDGKWERGRGAGVQRPKIWEHLGRYPLFRDDLLIATDWWNQSAHLPKPTPPKCLQATPAEDVAALADGAAAQASLPDTSAADTPALAAPDALTVSADDLAGKKLTAWGSCEPTVKPATPVPSYHDTHPPLLYPGAVVRVNVKDRTESGWGLVHAGGNVEDKYFVTMINWEGASGRPTRGYWKARFEEAYELRATLINMKQNTAFRLVNGVGDEIPGVIVDVIGSVAVCVLDDPARECYAALRELLGEIGIKHVYHMDAQGRLFAARAAMHVPDAHNRATLMLPSPHWASPDLSGPQTVKYLENGIPFLWTPNLPEGSFTGHYAVHRTARQLLLSIAKGKSVLDLFSYTGTMGAAAVSGGAKQVMFVESDREYCDLIARNLSLQMPKERWETFCRIECGEVHNLTTRHRYDITVVDPPDHTIEHVYDGKVSDTQLNYYTHLLSIAVNRTKRGGMIFLFVNPKGVPADFVTHKLLGLAKKSNTTLTVVRTIHPSVDFPQDITRQSSSYMGLVLQMS